MKQYGWILLLMMVTQTLLPAKDYNILDFGAVANGKQLNTASIQAAIDQAHADGGGRVVVPAGRFLSGSILLKSGVELHLAKKAVLLGSTNPDDYAKLHEHWGIGYKALVMAKEADHIAISGKGTLDGQGRQLALTIDSLFYAGKIDSADYRWQEKRSKWYMRPQVIQLFDCRHVSVTGVTVKNSACWVQTYALCQNLVIDHIRVESDAFWNNDGIDIVDCRNVRITNCYINAADDGICLKSYICDLHLHHPTIRYCDSIYIAHCTVRSSANAVKLGTASFAGIKNVVIEDIKVFDTFRSAIAVEVVHGGFVDSVLVDRVRATNTGNAIFIRLGQQWEDVGTLKNVTIRNVKVEVPFERNDYAYDMRGPELPFFHNVFPSSIAGLPGHPVENVTLENIEITYPGRGNKAYAHVPVYRLDEVPEQRDKYPEFSMFGELPAWGFYVRHAEGLTMNNVKVRIRKPDYRPAFVFDDVKGLKLGIMEIVGDDKGADGFFMRNVEQAGK
jgi:polygalacturonase